MAYMEKCHCSGVRFEQIVKVCREQSKDYREIAKNMNVSETCTACREDMVGYCEEKLGYSKIC